MKETFIRLVEIYPSLRGRDNPNAFPRIKIVSRSLDRNKIVALDGKPGIKQDRKEDLTVTCHTAGQDVLWIIPIVSVLENSEIMRDMDPVELDGLKFVFLYDNYMDEY